MFSHILVAVDGSPSSMRAAQLAAEMASKNEGTLRIVVAYEPVPEYLGEPHLQAAISIRMKTVENILQTVQENIRQFSGNIHTEALEGTAADVILHVAQVHQVDVIVMGTRGLGSLSGLFLGSQSQKVLQHASCPVLIVP